MAHCVNQHPSANDYIYPEVRNISFSEWKLALNNPPTLPLEELGNTKDAANKFLLQICAIH